MINQVVPPAEVLDAAVALAERIARNGPLALQATKQLVRTASTDLERAERAGRGVAAEGVRQRGRQGGCDRLHREARPRVEGSLSAGRHGLAAQEVGRRLGRRRLGCVSGSGVVGAFGRCQRHRDPGHDDVVAAAQRRREHQVDLVVQDPVAQLVRPDDGDQHDELIVGVLRPQLVDEGDDRLDDRGVLGVQHPERYAAVPPVPVASKRCSA